jgi:predicted nucleic acid-binding protein
MRDPYLFDSHALLAFFQKETGSEIVKELLKKSFRDNISRLINIINLGEIVYLIKRRLGSEKKIEVLARVHQLEFTILSASDALVMQAAELKADYPISYADCFALASAIEHSATIVTGDPDFKLVQHLVGIEWDR